jgi:hypothetical protein
MKILRVKFDGLKVKVCYTSWKDSKSCWACQVYKEAIDMVHIHIHKQKLMFLYEIIIPSNWKFISNNYRTLLITRSNFLIFLWGHQDLWMIQKSFDVYFQFTKKLCGRIFLGSGIPMKASSHMWLRKRALSIASMVNGTSHYTLEALYNKQFHTKLVM